MKRLFAIASVLAVTGLGVGVGCGGEGQSSRDEFSASLQSIHRQGSEQWGRLAERAKDVKPDEPLQAAVKEAMRDIVEFQVETAVELAELDPPQGADDEVDMLIDGLRERTQAFEEALEVGHFTQQLFDQIGRAGNKIDQAFRRLRNEGYVPMADEHEDE